MGRKANMIYIRNLLRLTQYCLKWATPLVVTFGNSFLCYVGNCTRKESVYLPWISPSSKSNYLNGDKKWKQREKVIEHKTSTDDK